MWRDVRMRTCGGADGWGKREGGRGTCRWGKGEVDEERCAAVGVWVEDMWAWCRCALLTETSAFRQV